VTTARPAATLRPEPELATLTLARAEAALGACGASLSALLAGGAVGVPVPEHPGELFAVALTPASAAFCARLGDPLRTVVAGHVVTAVVRAVRAAGDEAAAHRARLEADVSDWDRDVFAAWRDNQPSSRRPLRASFASLDPREWEAVTTRWPLRRLLCWMADCEVAAYYREKDETYDELKAGSPRLN